MRDLIQDIRYAVRLLIKDRGFTVAALLTLALCIGANTAIFSIVNSVLIKPLPFSQSDRIVIMQNSYPNAGSPRSSSGIPDYYDRLAGTTTFEEIALYQETGLTIGETGKPERVDAMAVTPSFFRLLRVPALRGHTFTEEEGQLGNVKRAILSYNYWTKNFAGRDPVGQSLRVAGEAYTIVGVMPRDFVFDNADVEVYVPLAITPEMKSDERRHSNSWEMIARLRPGATLEQAQAQINAINARNRDLFPQFRDLLDKAGFHTIVADYQQDLTRNIRSTLYLLQIGVLIVLLIGCVNIANLILVRSTARSRELATRSAIGASHGRLVRQLFSESVILGIAGGALGLAVGYAGLRMFMAFGGKELPRTDIHLDAPVIAVTFGLSIIAGLIFGSIPAIRLRGVDLNSVFREEGRAVAVSRQAAAARAFLVITQVALAFTMLVGAGLLLTSFARTLGVDPGFKPDHLLTANISLPVTRYKDDNSRMQLQSQVLEKVRAIPGVTSAAFTSTIPMSDDFDSSVMSAEGYVAQPHESVLSPLRIFASSDYFQTMGIQIVKGRGFNETDQQNSQQVAVIDEFLAKKYFAGKDPIGKRICQCVPGMDLGKDTIVWKTVVGVAKTIRMENLTGEQTPGEYYFAYPQEMTSHMYLVARTSTNPSSVVSSVRSVVTSLDPDLPLYSIATMQEKLSESLTTTRIRTILIAGFGAVAVLLAAIGIYGVLAYSVAQRRSEIGVRLALGSSASTVFKLVIRQGMTLLAAGLVIGGVAAIFLSKLVSKLLYGVTTTDPLVYLSVAVVLSAVALFACAIPARRAMLVEPGVALRG